MAWWDPVELAEGRTFSIRIGTLQLWVRRSRDEWAFNWDRHGEAAGSSEDAPAPATWHRVIGRDFGRQLQLLPRTPDRPLLVSPQQPLSIAKDVRATLYIYLPCWVQVTVGRGGHRLVLMEAPSEELSRTWLGDYTRGKLCYHYETAAVRQWRQMRRQQHHLVGTLQLHNRANRGMLRFTRFCLHSEPMSIYPDGEWLWTSIVSVTWRGTGQNSELNYRTETPKELKSPEIGRPRVDDAESLLGRLAGIRFFIGS